MNQSPKSNHLLNAIIFLATLALFAPTWLWLVQAWWSDPYYSHGPLVLVVSLYFAWTQRHVIASRVAAKQSPHSTTEIASSQNPILATLAPHPFGSAGVTSWLIIIVALGVHTWAMLWRAYYISALMIPLALLGLLMALYGWQTARRFWFPLVFLIFMIPLPIAERFGPPLESFAATSATTLAQWIGIAARNEGSQVFLPNTTFTVGIPCGGLRSIIAIVTLVVLFAYITQGRAWARALILLAAVPIAIAANTLRLAFLFMIANFWGSDAAMNYFHDWSSPILFLGAFALLLALAKLVGATQVRWDAVLPDG